MKEQADKLRKVVNDLKLKQFPAAQNLSIKSKTARIITITSGKGGVGKTNISVNLAIALSELGLRVIILDADFGLANIDVLFGIIPKFTLADMIHGKRNIFEILSDGPNNIKFISGGSGVEDLVKLDKNNLEEFLKNISLLDKIADVIIIDTGAGLSDNVMRFIMASDEVLLVTTPEPTSITDAYALIKMISNRDRQKIIKLIVNRSENEKEAKDILDRLCLVADKFLGLDLYPLGYIPQDDSIIKAVKQQEPFSLSYPRSHASKHIREIARKLVETDQGYTEPASDAGVKSFMRKLINFIKA